MDRVQKILISEHVPSLVKKELHFPKPNHLYDPFYVKNKEEIKKGGPRIPAWVLYTRITQQNQLIHITANVSPLKITAKSLLPGFSYPQIWFLLSTDFLVC